MAQRTMSSGDLFRVCVREILRPALGELGFRGGPRVFVKECDEVWVAVALNTRNAEDTVMFTADLAVSSKRILARRHQEPRKAPARSNWHREHRLGSLIGPGYDRWWMIVADEGLEAARAVMTECTSVLLSEGLPAIDRYASDEKLREAWRQEMRWLSPRERSWLQDLEAD